MITPGKTFTQSHCVKPNETAAVYGSGKLEVYATPALVALMENTAIKCLEGLLEPGTDTVGIEINVKHLKASAIGKEISCRATIREVEGRRIRFELEARDEKEIIGTAVHDRFIIDPVKFMNKLS